MHPYELSSRNILVVWILHWKHACTICSQESRPTNITEGKSTYGSASRAVASCLEESKPTKTSLQRQMDSRKQREQSSWWSQIWIKRRERRERREKAKTTLPITRQWWNFLAAACQRHGKERSQSQAIITAIFNLSRFSQQTDKNSAVKCVRTSSVPTKRKQTNKKRRGSVRATSVLTKHT